MVTRDNARLMSLMLCVLLLSCGAVQSREYHVSVEGDDTNKGTAGAPFETISKAAEVARAGDVITVHEGTYRERINPPRGGRSDGRRIVYRAAPGEKVVVKGSEVIDGWRKVENDTWKVTIPNSFFGDFNPYSDLIKGDWFNRKGRDHHTGAVYLNGHWLTEAAKLDDVLKPAGAAALWFGQAGEENTTIWAQFKGMNPNEATVEINVRQSVFYPDKPGVNYITVSGFTMMHAATPWAPPTAEQIGLIGTHWSKGWIIENNDISYSTCVGITLGKYGDQWDNTSQNTAAGYVKTIERALENGWSKENIGGHIVRNNRISHCEQAGLVGSMGAVFSTITGNVIHDIHVRQLFTGAEMAGIKIHAALDTEISRNHIYRTCRGIWLDWMTQGTRVSGNLLHDNDTREDLFVEVNHGPFMVDNNIFLSPKSLTDWSQGGAYVHNLFAGRIVQRPELRRDTPFQKPHSTQVAGLQNTAGGDDRFYNNIFAGSDGLAPYDKAAHPMFMAGNVFLKGAKAGRHEQNPLVKADFDLGIDLAEKDDGHYLRITVDKKWATERSRQLVTSELLGRAKIPNLPYQQPDGQAYRIDADYFGRARSSANPFPGPFEPADDGKLVLKVWPVAGELSSDFDSSAKRDVRIDPSGTWRREYDWNGTLVKETVRLNIKQDGKIVGALSANDTTFEIKNIKLKGRELSFSISGDYQGTQWSSSYKGTIKGDEIDGAGVFTVGDQSWDFGWTPKRGVEMEDVVGTWQIRIESPDGNILEPTMKISQDGDAYKSVYTSTQDRRLDVKGLRIDKNALKFSVTAEYDGYSIKVDYRGRPYGDKLSGSLDYDFGGTTGQIEFTARRKQEKNE
ncbi:MAG: DUF1565 domain-containing protein [Planctomycetota bacterium]